jgi:hypothetical protein
MVQKLSDFQNMLMFDNKNIERIVKDVVNESSNAAVISIFEDAVILLDHKTGNFYKSNYTLDTENSTMVFENFDQIELEKDDSFLKESVENFFENDDDYAYIEKMKEAVTSSMYDTEGFLGQIIGEAISSKSFDDIIDYSQLKEVNLEESEELKNKTFFKKIQKRIDEKPMSSIKYFDWNHDVKISLVESETGKRNVKNAKEKAMALSKDANFKELAIGALTSLKEGDETDFILLVESYPCIMALSPVERKEMFGKAILVSKLMESRSSVLKKAERVINESEELEELKPEDDEESDEGDDKKKKEKSSKETKASDETDGIDLTDEEIDELLKALEKAGNKVEDAKLLKKIEGLADDLEDAKESGIDAKEIKECVELIQMML